MAAAHAAAQTGYGFRRQANMNDHSTSLNIAANLLEQSDERALRGLDKTELARLRSTLQRTLEAIDGRLAETQIEEILGLLPDLATYPARWNN